MENESKVRILYLYKILTELSDEAHPISTVELIKLLNDRYGVQAHRVTISWTIVNNVDTKVRKSAG